MLNIPISGRKLHNLGYDDSKLLEVMIHEFPSIINTDPSLGDNRWLLENDNVNTTPLLDFIQRLTPNQINFLRWNPIVLIKNSASGITISLITGFTGTLSAFSISPHSTK